MSVPDIVAGMDPGALLLFSNPAALADLPAPQLSLARANWLDDLSMNAASFGLPVAPAGLVWSLGTRLLYSGEIRGYDAAENVVETESYYGASFSTCVSRRFEHLGLSLGAAVTYLREHLPGETGDGFAFSFGAAYTRSRHRLEAFADDVGGKISFEGREYATQGRYVLGYGYSVGGVGRLDLGTQAVFFGSEFKQIEFGGAYRFPRFFTLRAGFDHAIHSSVQSREAFSAGLGFRHGSFSLDYAFTPQEYFSSTHTFSVGFTFGNGSGIRRQAASVGQPGTLVSGATQEPVTANPVASAERPAGQANGATAKASYVLVGGTHARRESAEAEVRALRLVKIPAAVEREQDKFRVVVERFDSRDKAEAALARYGSVGQGFRIITQNG